MPELIANLLHSDFLAIIFDSIDLLGVCSYFGQREKENIQILLYKPNSESSKSICVSFLWLL